MFAEEPLVPLPLCAATAGAPSGLFRNPRASAWPILGVALQVSSDYMSTLGRNVFYFCRFLDDSDRRSNLTQAAGEAEQIVLNNRV